MIYIIIHHTETTQNGIVFIMGQEAIMVYLINLSLYYIEN